MSLDSSLLAESVLSEIRDICDINYISGGIIVISGTSDISGRSDDSWKSDTSETSDISGICDIRIIIVNFGIMDIGLIDDQLNEVFSMKTGKHT